MKLAFVFAGQGTQTLGMGKSLYDAFPRYKERMDVANHLFTEDLIDIIANDADRLNHTLYAQPAIFSMSAGICDILSSLGFESEGSCGLSLGEYGAYYDAGIFDFETGFRTIVHRAYFMHQATKNSEYGMLALLAPLEKAQAVINDYPTCYIANYNLPNQMVLGGPKAILEEITTKKDDYSIRRAVPLSTSGAFHTPYMEDAALNYENYVRYLKLNNPLKPLYLNTTAGHLIGPIKGEMVKQLTHPVKFYAMIETMIKDGFDTFVEIGPGRVLSGLIKKIEPKLAVFNIEDAASLSKTVDALKELSYNGI